VPIRSLCPGTIIASANPSNTSSAWENSNEDKIDLNDIPIIKPLWDRFDLVFIFKSSRDENVNRDYAYKKAELYDKLIPDYSTYLQKHIMYAKRFKPVLSTEVKSMFSDYYTQISKKFGTPRILETLFRLAIARAKLRLKREVDAEDATEIMRFFNVVIGKFQEAVPISANPRDVTYNECVSILRRAAQWEPISFEEVIRAVCDRNEQVKRYLGRDLRLRNNIKLRHIREMVLNHEHVKLVQDKPTVFQWIEKSCDPCDPCDPVIKQVKDENSQDYIQELSDSIENQTSDEEDHTGNIL
jgi:hypothetical protein